MSDEKRRTLQLEWHCPDCGALVCEHARAALTASQERAGRAEEERDEARAGRVAARAEVESLQEARREEHREASAAAAYSARRQTELERDLAAAQVRVAALERVLAEMTDNFEFTSEEDDMVALVGRARALLSPSTAAPSPAAERCACGGMREEDRARRIDRLRALGLDETVISYFDKVMREMEETPACASPGATGAKETP